MRSVFWISAAALTALQQPLAAQSVLTGAVMDDSTSRPIPGVEAVLEGGDRRVTTDNAGRFSLEMPSGTRIVLFRLIGYRPVRVRARIGKDDTLRFDFRMTREGVQLDPIEVTANREPPIGRGGFTERRRLGFGKFLDSVPLRRAGGRRLSEVLRSIGVRIVLDRNSAFAASPIRGAGCWVNVILDGVTIFRADRHDEPPDLAQEFRTESLESIEYYRSPAEVPIEFGGANADCGVLVLWTRRG